MTNLDVFLFFQIESRVRSIEPRGHHPRRGAFCVLVDLLVQHLLAARAKHKLQDFLRSIKDQHRLSQTQIRVTGTAEEIASAAHEAAQRGYLEAAALARVVDQVEETGAQHIFLFTINQDEIANLRENAFASNFQSPPREPTEAFYSMLPTANRLYYFKRDDLLVVKQIRTTDYWIPDPTESRETENKRITVHVRERKRSVNLLLLDIAHRLAEVRIDRTTNRDDRTLALDLFSDFRSRLSPVVDFHGHFAPVPIWNGFDRMARARGETYMATDEAEDPSIVHRLSNRRGRTRGSDVRDHPSYDLSATRYRRKSLNLYWLVPATEGDPTKVHTLMSQVRLDEPPPAVDYGKVYVAAKVEPSELKHVLQRIRHFAT